MRLDFFLFFISLFFSLAGLLLEDVTSAGLQWIAVLKYVPLLILYAKHFRRSFSSFLPILFAVFLLAWSFLGGHYGMVAMLGTIMVPVMMYVYTRIQFSRKEISGIALLLALAFFLYIIICFVTHFRQNPNQIAFKILILTVNLFFCLYTNGRKRFVWYSESGRKHTLISPGILAILGISFLLILYTESRNSLLVFLILVMAFVFRKRVAEWNIWGWLLFVLLVLFVLYPFVYCLLSDSFKGTGGTEMMGQDVFSGREYIWVYIFAQLADTTSFLFGNIDTSWWDKSMHNSALDIVVRNGVPTMVIMELMVLFYFKRICSIIKNKNNNKYKPLLLLVIGTMIWGLNESGLFLGFSFFLFFPYSILHSKNEKDIVVSR